MRRFDRGQKNKPCNGIAATGDFAEALQRLLLAIETKCRASTLRTGILQEDHEVVELAR